MSCGNGGRPHRPNPYHGEGIRTGFFVSSGSYRNRRGKLCRPLWNPFIGCSLIVALTTVDTAAVYQQKKILIQPLSIRRNRVLLFLLKKMRSTGLVAAHSCAPGFNLIDFLSLFQVGIYYVYNIIDFMTSGRMWRFEAREFDHQTCKHFKSKATKEHQAHIY